MCIRDRYEIKEGRLIVGNHSNPLPKNWEDRSEKYKKAYDVRISDWSSDVCSSDLRHHGSDCQEAIA